MPHHKTHPTESAFMPSSTDGAEVASPPASSSKTTSHSKRKVLLSVAGGVAALLLVVGGLWYRAERQATAQRAAFMVQQQKLQDFWKAEGLSDEQIQTKMRENRIQQRPANFNSPWFSLMRTFRRLTGGGSNFGGRGGGGDFGGRGVSAPGGTANSRSSTTTNSAAPAGNSAGGSSGTGR